MSNFPSSGEQSPFSVQPEQPGPPSGSSRNTILIILSVMVVLMLMCGGILFALLVPAVSTARNAAQRMSRINQVKQIGLGIHNYHSAYKQLPLTIAANSSGEELAGWRIGISPFIEGQRQWNTIIKHYGPESRSLVSNDAPMALQAVDGQPGETHLFAIVADNSMFPPTPNLQLKFRDVTDGLSQTAMIIELPNRTTVWTSNENLTPDEAYQAIQALKNGQVALLLMGDGMVISVPATLDRTVFDSLITRDGQETIDPTTVGDF